MIRCATLFFIGCLLGGCPEANSNQTDPSEPKLCEQHSDCGANEFCDDGVCHEVHFDDSDAGSTSVDTYVAGLEKVGEMGRVKLTLVESDPLPQDLTLYTWQLLLTDAEGTPINGAQIVAEPRMPDHGHGTNPQFTEAEAVDGEGRYQLLDMNLFMAGVWQINIVVTLVGDGDAGAVEDTLHFRFDLEG